MFKKAKERLSQFLYIPDDLVTAELIPGVERPTRTLALMIASEILKSEYKPVTEKGVSCVKYGKFTVSWSAEDGRLITIGKKDYPRWVVVGACEIFNQRDGKPKGYWTPEDCNRHDRIRTAVQHECEKFLKNFQSRQCKDVKTSFNVLFSPDELTIISNALDTAAELQKERDLNKKEFDNQQRAVDAISNFMGVSS